MTPETEPPRCDERELEEILAFDRALISGSDLPADAEPGSSLTAVHECQRLLEAVWPRSAPLSLELPRRFGRYVIERELGRGAFGVVFMASDTVLGRRVALKVPRPEILVTPDVRRRFLREAEAASRLDHPHIVPVYDVGEVGLVCYIASAYCEGMTLADWLRQRSEPVPFGSAARLVTALADAVAQAHERGILHRDLKPSNILLTRQNASASADGGECLGLPFIPRICDFGLARLLDQDSHETCSGVPIGSPGYMAPEQAAGRLREHGPATDVYALGAILYELLVGRPPHRGETDLETLRLVTDHDPASPRVLRPSVPRDLETIVLKCLEKRPLSRYASMSALAEDLGRFIEGKPVRARPLGPCQRLTKWTRRRPLHAALLIGSVAVITAIVGLVSWSRASGRRHGEAVRTAVAQAENDTRRVERSAQDVRIAQARALEQDRATERAERFALGSQVRLIHETLESGNFGLAGFMLEAHRPGAGRSRQAGFAWDYVRGLFHPDQFQLGEVPGYGEVAFLKLAIAPDNRTLAAATSHGRVQVWDLVDRKLRRTLTHGTGPDGLSVYWLAFSFDGRLLATASEPRTVKLWDLSTYEELAALPTEVGGEPAYRDGMVDLSFTDAADALVVVAKSAADRRHQIWFWSVPPRGGRPQLKDRVELKQLPSYGAGGPLKPPAWSADAERAAPWLAYAREHMSVLDDGVTLVIKNGPRATLFDPDQFLPAVQIHQTLAIPLIRDRAHTGFGKADIERLGRQARRVVGATGSEYRRLPSRPDLTILSPDGRTAAVHFAGMYLGGLGVALIDVASGRTLLTNAPARWRVVDLAFSPDGQSLVMAGFDSNIHVWRLRPAALAGHHKETWSLAFSPDGKTLASSSDDGTIKLWDMAGGRQRRVLKGHESLVTDVVYSRDGALFASAGWDKTIRLWDAATGEPLATLRGHTDHVRCLAFSPDGTSIVSAGDDHAIHIWNVTHGSEPVAPLLGHTGKVYSLVFSADGKTLFSGALDETIRQWDWPTGVARAVWAADDQVYSLALAPDGQTLAAGYEKGGLTLWNIASGKREAILRAQTKSVLGLAFSPDGLTLAAASRDQTVRLYDPATGGELLTLSGHQAPVHAAKFSPDGTILATGSHDGAIKIWRSK
jgi:WD40 repeat protein/tRNA A-37 threonylcarbamoyl transferase component Bud32